MWRGGVIRFASEDVGLADPRALEMAVAAYQACHFIGHAGVHGAPDRRRWCTCRWRPSPTPSTRPMSTPRATRSRQLAEPVPLVIRNAPTRLMKELHYGKGYQYAHDTEDKLTTMQCLPDSLLGQNLLPAHRTGAGEQSFKARLEQIKDWKQRHGG